MPTMQNYVYRLLFDQRLLEKYKDDKNKSDFLKKRIERHKEDIVLEAIRIYGSKIHQ